MMEAVCSSETSVNFYQLQGVLTFHKVHSTQSPSGGPQIANPKWSSLFLFSFFVLFFKLLLSPMQLVAFCYLSIPIHSPSSIFSSFITPVTQTVLFLPRLLRSLLVQSAPISAPAPSALQHIRTILKLICCLSNFFLM
jgi:hypothetical protein